MFVSSPFDLPRYSRRYSAPSHSFQAPELVTRAMASAVSPPARQRLAHTAGAGAHPAAVHEALVTLLVVLALACLCLQASCAMHQYRGMTLRTTCDRLVTWQEAVAACASQPFRQGVLVPATLAVEALTALATIEDGAIANVSLGNSLLLLSCAWATSITTFHIYLPKTTCDKKNLQQLVALLTKPPSTNPPCCSS